jgi:hypothetical protein
MEYRRAYKDEKPDQDLVERHEREIFPLMKKRYLFAEVADFLLYDLYDKYGHVNENVFAYSNRCGNEKALILYNNAYASVWGWIRMSAAYREKENKNLVQRGLGEGLGLHSGEGMYCIFREQRANLWFIRSCAEIYGKGLFINLKGYETQVFLDVYEVADDERGSYRRLAEFLDGAGTENISASMREITFQPLYAALRSILYDWYRKLKAALFEALNIEKKAEPSKEQKKQNAAARLDNSGQAAAGFRETDIQGFTAAVREFIARVNDFSGKGLDCEKTVALILDRLENALQVLRELRQPGVPKIVVNPATMDSWKFLTGFEDIHAAAEILFAYAVLQALGDISLFEEWALDTEMTNFFVREDCDIKRVRNLCLLLKILLRHDAWYDNAKKYGASSRARKTLEYLFSDTDIQRYAGVNIFEGEIYFNKEGFLSLIWWLCVISCIRKPPAGEPLPGTAGEDVLLCSWLKAYEKAEYRLRRLFEISGAKSVKYAKNAKKKKKKNPAAKEKKPRKEMKAAKTGKTPRIHANGGKNGKAGKTVKKGEPAKAEKPSARRKSER